MFDLLLDTNKLEQSEYTEDETGCRITFSLLQDGIINDILYHSSGKIDFYLPI
jgi:hypothetical protein